MNGYNRTYAQIDLDAIESNINEAKKRIKPGTKLAAIIKADGYGHGSVELGHFLEDKVDFFGVALIEEAIELRRNGITLPILLLAYTSPLEFPDVIRNDIHQTIYTYDDALALSNEAVRQGKSAHIHIGVDTGMTRIGFSCNEESADIVKNIAQLPGVVLDGLFSHYACADSKDKTSADDQTKRFDEFVSFLKYRQIDIPIKHLCNSAGIIDLDNHYNMVRMGISLYGLYPSDEVEFSNVNLTPAMKFVSHITRVKNVPAGVGISYGHIYKTCETRTIATVSAGYADGYPRALSNTGRVIINGKYAHITGKVCMDQFMVDVTDIPGAKVGDEVILIGSEGECTVSAEEVGALSMSFNYETVCRVSRRVPRLYTRGGRVIKTVNYLER